MVPQANDNFDESWPLQGVTPTSIDLIESIEDDFQQALDAPTAFLQRDRFQGLPPGTSVGEIYEIGEPLGAGSMGEVYEARHMELNKHVAIKVINQHLSKDDRAISRFVTEAKLLASIHHPAIVSVEHVGKLPDGRAYFVMELLRGEPLSTRLARGRLPLHVALGILEQMTRGLSAAHASGVIHRDLKPDNTFLVQTPSDEVPTVKIFDFGLAKRTALAVTREEDDEEEELSDSGRVVGTPLYMSPEQIRGFHLDARSDIYALGCIAYELVLGTRPFPQALTTPVVCTAHLHETPPLPRSLWSGIPPQLDLILFGMLAKDPADRPTLEQLRSVITALCSASSTSPPPGPSQRPRWRWSIRTILTVILAVSILSTGALLGAVISSKIRARLRAGEAILNPISTKR